MQVAILTVGDEVLSGDTTNTNATWLARRLTDRGATVARILTLPDDATLVAETVREWADAFDAVIVTGGLGGTHDDVTAEAIASAFGRGLVVDDAVREDVIETVAAYRERNPEVVEAHDLELDVDAWAAVPDGARVLPNPAGLCPGFVVGPVYAFPGIPDEMKAIFEDVSAEFDGDVVSRTLYTSQPEGSMIDDIDAARDRFDVTVGSYPDIDGPNRVKVVGTDPEAVEAATEWLRDRLDIQSEP